MAGLKRVERPKAVKMEKNTNNKNYFKEKTITIIITVTATLPTQAWPGNIKVRRQRRSDIILQIHPHRVNYPASSIRNL